MLVVMPLKHTYVVSNLGFPLFSSNVSFTYNKPNMSIYKLKLKCLFYIKLQQRKAREESLFKENHRPKVGVGESHLVSRLHPHQ